MFAVAFYCLHNVKFHVLDAAITASVLPSDGAMTVKTVESVEIGFRSRWTSVEVVNSRDGQRSTWFRSKWKSVEVTYNRLKMHVLCRFRINIIFQNKTLLVNVLQTKSQNETFWYQFCHFKHFLKEENIEDSLASSYGEFYWLSCYPVWDWVTIGPRFLLSFVNKIHVIIGTKLKVW